MFTWTLCLHGRYMYCLAFGEEATQDENLSKASNENDNRLANRPVLNSLIHVLGKRSTL